MASFERLGLREELIYALEDKDWLLPRDVQDESVPLILGGADVMIAAETGSGKTGAFCLPALQLIYEHMRGEAKTLDPEFGGGSGLKPEFVSGQKRWKHVFLDPKDRDAQFAISPDGLQGQTRDFYKWNGCRAGLGVQGSSARVCFEVRIEDEGLGRVGWAAAGANFNLGTCASGFGYGGTAMKSNAGQFIKYGEKFAKGDVLASYLDLQKGEVSFSRNGKDLGVAFEIPKNLRNAAFFPAVVMRNCHVTVNFGVTAEASQNEKAAKPVHLSQVKQGFTMMAFVNPQDAVTTKKGGSGGGGQKQSKGEKKGKNSGTAVQKQTLCVIVEPTKLLARQVFEELVSFTSHLNEPTISVGLFMGGDNRNTQIAELRAGCNIVVGTPARLASYVGRDLNMAHTRLFILDEADELFEQGFKKDVYKLFNALPDSRAYQVVICSATLHSPSAVTMSADMCINPQWVDLKGKDSVPDTVDNSVVMVDPLQDKSWRSKDKVAHVRPDGVHRHTNSESGAPRPNSHNFNPHGPSTKGVKWMKPVSEYKYDNDMSQAVKLLKPVILLEIIESFEIDQALIFCRTRVDCENLHEFLVARGGGRRFGGKGSGGKENVYSSAVLHAGRENDDRKATLEAFRDGDVRFMIATDVAARGMDVKALPFVISMTLPDRPEQYIHRIGRVGRAEMKGMAISLVSTVPERVWYHGCNRKKQASCSRVALHPKGCTVWYTEPEIFNQIEQKFKLDIPRLDRSNLTSGKKALLDTMKKQMGGARGKSEIAERVSQHVQLLAPKLRDLYAIETGAQANFLSFQRHDWSSTPQLVTVDEAKEAASRDVPAPQLSGSAESQQNGAGNGKRRGKRGKKK